MIVAPRRGDELRDADGEKATFDLNEAGISETLEHDPGFGEIGNGFRKVLVGRWIREKATHLGDN